MKKLFRPYLVAAMLGSLLFSTACDDDDDDPDPIDDTEEITSMTISMEPDATTKGVDPATATYTLSQANPTLQLAANTQYNATVTFNDDIEDEVTEEGTDHELFYVANPASLFSNITKTDMDANNRPIGLAATVTTGAAGTGTLVVTLKHQPGLKGSTSNPNVGETDVQANFNVIIQ